ncbi:hypothetical protein JCM8097_005602 [Rhodosporidiobolus ruineniae]
MQADLSQPPPPGAAPPPPRGSSLPPTSSRPNLLTRQSTARARRNTAEAEQGQLDKSISKWDEWDRWATSLEQDWVVEDDMLVLAKALSDEPAPGVLDPSGPASPTDGSSSPLASFKQGNGHGSETSAGVEKIRAVSDFAPIKQKVKRGPKRRKDVVREGWAYHVSRWPLLFLIFSIISLEFVCYLFVRQMVNIIEFFSSWRGERGRLRLALRNAKTYDEWKQRALALDDHFGLSAWKQTPQNAYYDAPLVRRVVRALKELRNKDDAEGVAAVLHAAVRSNFAGTESFRLYSETYYGTKELVQDYVDEVSRCLEYIRNTPPSAIPLDEKADFFRSVAKNLGASALCLSGGASFGYYHFGVVRALLDEDLIPRVVTGTSAGAIVAAFLCTRTNTELRSLLTPTLADRITACSEPTWEWMKRAWRTGARFDTVQWARKASFFTMGSMTFREAYERTGRVLNVSVIPYDTHSPTKLLNYLTAPDCVIYTAVIASAAVPGIINPVVLLTKDRNGRLRPWEFQGKHKDGSLRVDIPLQSLHLLYNVNFSVVSQTNPHIHLWHYAPRGSPGHPVQHRKGKGWRGGFWLSAAEQFWKIEMLKWFRVIRDLELLPEFGGQNWSSVFLQKFEGTVTIFPKTRFIDWFRILTDPDRDELARMIRVGQQVTWPKIKMIENRLKIERQIDLGREDIRRQLASSSSSDRPQLIHHGSSSSTHLGGFASSNDQSRTASPHQFPHANIDRDDQFASMDPEEDEDEDDANGAEGEGEGDDSLGSIAAIDYASSTLDRSRRAFSEPPVSSSPSRPSSAASSTTGTPAKRRQAILAKLGLGRAAARGTRDAAAQALGGGGDGERDAGAREVERALGGQGGAGGRWTDESDWTSGGEGEVRAPSRGKNAGGNGGLRSRSAGNGRKKTRAASSGEEGEWR